MGEYLDKHAIEKAKVLAGVVDRTFNRFSIKKLTLSGFVVNADPFIQWFDHRRLRNIHFKDDCIDAGFYLPRSLKGVNITSPDEERAFPMRRIELKGLKVVQLKGGKKIAEVPYRGRQTVQMRPELVSTIKSIEDVRIEVIESQARVEKPINGPGVKRLHRKPVPQPAVEPVKADSASC